MRSPSPTFREALKAYQRRLPALTSDAHWKGQIAHEVIARWIEHAECEAIWTALRPLVPLPVTPEQLILEVILARWDAEWGNIIVGKAPELEAKIRARTKRHLQNRQYRQLAHENAALDDFITRRARALGREKTGPRIGFMRRLSAGFTLRCGQPLDNLVRVLTEIAFGEPITTEAVRDARRRHRRSTRPQK